MVFADLQHRLRPRRHLLFVRAQVGVTRNQSTTPCYLLERCVRADLDNRCVACYYGARDRQRRLLVTFAPVDGVSTPGRRVFSPSLTRCVCELPTTRANRRYRQASMRAFLWRMTAIDFAASVNCRSWRYRFTQRIPGIPSVCQCLSCSDLRTTACAFSFGKRRMMFGPKVYINRQDFRMVRMHTKPPQSPC